MLFITNLTATLPTGQVTVQGNNLTLQGGMLYLKAPIVAALHDGGTFAIPAGSFDTIVTGTVSGQQTTVEALNTSSVTGTYDEVNGTFLLNGSVALQVVTATVNLELSFGFVNRPPVANAGPDQTVECTLPSREGNVNLTGSSSFDPDSGDHIATYIWSAGEAFVSQGITPNATTTLGLGTRVAKLETVDTQGSMSSDVSRITVVDTHPPVFSTLPVVTDTACDPASQAVTIPVPTATDACDPASVKVSGVIVSKNGQPLSPPIAIANGTATLSAGSFGIVWTATDGSGNSATATQTVQVRPGIEASDAISIDDSASVRLQNGSFAMVGNTGTGTVNLGVQAQTGNITTRGGVFLSDRSIVNGNVVAGGTITRQNQTTVTGTITTNTAVTLPAGKTLAGIVFPSSNQGPVDLEPGVSRTLAPGSFGALNIKSSATLSLSSGTYFFTSFDLEPQATLRLNQASGAIQIYISGNVIDRGQMLFSGGSSSGFVLGYSGTSTLFVQSPFPGGTVIAPNADVVVSSLGASAFSGQLFAKDIEIQPSATVTCVAAP